MLICLLVASSKESSGGRGGQLMFFSKDRKIILKTITAEEFQTFQRIFPQYYAHFELNPNSLIAKFYGLYEFEF